MCLCDAYAAVGSIDTEHHAHHDTQSGTNNSSDCPHPDCDGECASLTGVAADDGALLHVPRTIEVEDPAALPVIAVIQIPFTDIRLGPVSTYTPPTRVSETPISRFDRLLA